MCYYKGLIPSAIPARYGEGLPRCFIQISVPRSNSTNNIVSSVQMEGGESLEQASLNFFVELDLRYVYSNTFCVFWDLFLSVACCLLHDNSR